MISPKYLAWREADELAFAAEQGVFAAARDRHAPPTPPSELDRVAALRGAADLLFEEAMAEIAAEVEDSLRPRLHRPQMSPGA
jgi:hypothetical protein